MNPSRTVAENALGCLLGTAVGDALGLPMEGLPRNRIEKHFAGPLRHRFFGGRGFLSDDTEQSLIVARALCQHRGEVDAFRRSVARGLRWWLASLPAGTGLATARAIFKLWLGVSPRRSGVSSAGNGAAMRAAIAGVLFANDEDRRESFSNAHCLITHRDPRALESVRIISTAAALAARQASTAEILSRLGPLMESQEMKALWTVIEESLANHLPVSAFTRAIGHPDRIPGFAPPSVAVSLFAWLRHRGDFVETLETAIRCGGDTDTIGSMAGGFAGIDAGENGIPRPWIEGLADFPRSVSYIRSLSACLGDGNLPLPSRRLWLIPARNLLFLLIVLGHGLARLFRP